MKEGHNSWFMPGVAFRRFLDFLENSKSKIPSAEEGLVVFVALGSPDGFTEEFLSHVLSTDIRVPWYACDANLLMTILYRGMALQAMLEEGLEMKDWADQKEAYLRQSTDALDELHRRVGREPVEHDPAYVLSMLKNLYRRSSRWRQL